MIKKLLDKGFSFSHGIIFLLAAPIVNPVIILTTYQVCKDYPALAGFRIGGGFLIALSIGLLFSLNKNNVQFLKVTIPSKKVNTLFSLNKHNVQFLKPEKQQTNNRLDANSYLHVHLFGEECLLPAHSPLSVHIKSFSSHYCTDFIGTVKYLILGSFLSAFNSSTTD